MNGAKQSVVFTFEKGKNDSKYSLTINDTSSGIKNIEMTKLFIIHRFQMII